MSTKAFLLIALIFLSVCSNAQSAPSSKKTTTQGTNKNAAAFFNGAFRSDDNKGFTVMHDGYFSAIAQDSTGRWAATHAGTYTVNDNNTITFKALYSSYPDHIGSLNTAEYTINGETLKLRHFKKLVDAQGRDITDQMPKDAWETVTKLK
ncbi:MAG: hypothetical protein M3342_16150 [Bacteroidota bacterium]|nr:hypothetical protein [Bacteroidota bacterium]